jgi:hypothetical protein
LGPLITGLLSTHQHFWVAFVVAGSLKVSYDLGMLALFAGRSKGRSEDLGGGASEGN